MWKAASAALALLAGGAEPAPASACEAGRFEDVPYTACLVDPARDDLRLFYDGADGALLGTFDRVDGLLAERGLALSTAMNGGMYHRDRRPVGLTVIDGREISPLVTRKGPGNFGLLPNGVFCLGPEGASVTESRAFAEARPACTYATQSGPMLVIDGKVHPRFLPGSDSRHVRNGVGVRPDGRVVMAISDAPVNLHTFARLFRDGLGAPDALYIDGNVSRLYDRASGRHDIGFPVGAILGTVAPLGAPTGAPIDGPIDGPASGG
jgi:uncharacterized protein YigE (DUF2233 family)